MKTTVIKVFLSCPEDIAQKTTALEIIERVLNRANLHYKPQIQFDLSYWKKGVPPGRGEPRVQDRINKRLVKHCDIFLGILWCKFGTPPGTDLEGATYSSGSEEEFYLSKELGKDLWILFCKKPLPYSMLNHKLVEEKKKIETFKKTLREEKIQYDSFEDEKGLERLLGKCLLGWFNDKYTIMPKENGVETPPKKKDFLEKSKGF